MPKQFSRESILIIAALKKHFALPATDISYITGINFKRTKAHINNLIEKKYLYVEKYSAHRYYRENAKLTGILDKALIAETIIQLKEVPSLEKDASIQVARTCYGHIAGLLGVKLKEKFLADGLIEEKDNNYYLTNKGIKRFTNLRLECIPTSKKRIQNIYCVKPCLDWTERRHHLGGNFGKIIAQYLFNLNWLEHFPGSRALRITEKGKNGIFNEFGLDFSFSPT